MSITRNFKFFIRTNFLQIFTIIFVLGMSSLVLCVPKQVAFATPIDEFGNFMTGWLTAPLRSAINFFMSAAVDNMRVQETGNLLTASWNNLFGDSQTSSLAIYASTVCNTIVKPIAYSILGFVVLVQFVKMTTTASNNDQIPLIRDIVMYMISVIIFYSLIKYSDQIFISIYDIVNHIGQQMTHNTQQIADFAYIDDSENDIGKLIGILLMSIVVVLASMIASAVAMCVCYIRAIQLYIYMSFSPIPLALFGIDETRNYAVSFIRNFAAVCLAACIMIFIFYCIPMISQIIFAKTTNDSVQLTVNVLLLAVLMVWSLTQSGGWAKEILGA